MFCKFDLFIYSVKFITIFIVFETWNFFKKLNTYGCNLKDYKGEDNSTEYNLNEVRNR